MNVPLLVLYDPHGSGERGPLWSSDCRPAPTLKALCGELLMAGWPLSTMLKLPNADEPELQRRVQTRVWQVAQSSVREIPTRRQNTRPHGECY